MRTLVTGAAVLAAPGTTITTSAQQPPAAGASTDKPFVAGAPLNLTPNTKVYGSFRFAESVSYDAEQDLHVAVNAGMPQDVAPNDGCVSLVDPDGSAHTLK